MLKNLLSPSIAPITTASSSPLQSNIMRNRVQVCTLLSQRRTTPRVPYRPGRLVSRVTTDTGFPAMTHPTTVPLPKLSLLFLRSSLLSPMVIYSVSPLMELPERIIGGTISPMQHTSYHL